MCVIVLIKWLVPICTYGFEMIKQRAEREQIKVFHISYIGDAHAHGAAQVLLRSYLLMNRLSTSQIPFFMNTS